MTDPTPPGKVVEYAASELLVVAPHPDDEALGCGGLLIRAAARGARIRVLFLSDGAAGCDAAKDRREATSRRREEAAAALDLIAGGAAESVHLAFPDGQLKEHLEELVAVLAGELSRRPPDLLLCPSPLEASGDHRAAFAAVHRVLTRMRPERPAAAVGTEARILLYEVNHPAYPNRLVDVGAELGLLARVIGCYRSQLERHDYLAAALGLRRFRALTLPPQIEAAEGYTELTLEDFTTRSLSRLVRHLGGSPELLRVVEGPRISVVVRTRDRPELLAEALGSLAASTYGSLEVVLVNDGGAPPTVAADYPVPLERVELGSHRGRAIAAQAGVERAAGDAVAFLDDDDIVEPEHYATLAGMLGGAGIRIAYTDAAVGVYEPGPAGWSCVERRLPYSRDFDPERLLVDNYIPFHTLLFERQALLQAGPFDPQFSFFEDWDLLIRLAAIAPFHHLATVTCEYRHFRGSGHHILGNDPRSRADFLANKARILTKHRALLGPGLLARVVDGLRAEAVELQETASQARRSQRQIEEEFHRQRGELVSVRAGLEHQGEELGRLYGEERRLRDLITTREREIGELGVEVGRLYGEIERLGELIAIIEGSRAWRLASWLRRWRR